MDRQIIGSGNSRIQVLSLDQVLMTPQEAEKLKSEEKQRVKKKTVETKPVQVQSPIITPSVNINSNQDFWTISGVNYRNGIYDVDLAKSLLNSGKSNNQEDWADYSEIARMSGDFHVGDMPLYHAVFTSLFNQKDKPESEEARAFIQKQMREKYLMTLTRIAYQPKGKDKVIHNFGTTQKYELEEKIVGKDRIIESGDNLALTVLLGDSDIDRIKSVYNWINWTDTYIYRLNSKPSSVDESVAGFVANSDGADLSCYWGPADSGSSLGVRLRPKGAGVKK
jgi:hypothetical protein